MEGNLNLEISKKVMEFESLLERIFPRKIFYKILLRGKGLEFEGYRKIGPQEDASFIDWKASARTGSLLARQYVEEREINAVFIVDLADNMIFGSTEKLKCEYCAELTAALAHVMISKGDRVGFFLFNDRVVKVSPPKGGKSQFDVLSFELSNVNNYGGKMNLSENLEEILTYLDPSIDLLILISDFAGFNEKCVTKIQAFGGYFETLAIAIRDPLDISFPDINKEIVIESPVSGEKLVINPKVAKKVYEDRVKRHREFIKRVLRDSKVDLLELTTGEDFVPALVDFLKGRSVQR